MKTKPQNKLFGELLREWREEYLGIKQDVLAALVQAKIEQWNQSGVFYLKRIVKREDISDWEHNRSLPPKPDIVRVLAHTIADELRKLDYPADGDKMFERLWFGTEQEIPVGVVSWQAAMLDTLMHHIPEDQRDLEWEIINAFIKVRVDKLKKIETQEHVTKLRHKRDGS